MSDSPSTPSETYWEQQFVKQALEHSKFLHRNQREQRELRRKLEETNARNRDLHTLLAKSEADRLKAEARVEVMQEIQEDLVSQRDEHAARADRAETALADTNKRADETCFALGEEITALRRDVNEHAARADHAEAEVDDVDSALREVIAHNWKEQEAIIGRLEKALVHLWKAFAGVDALVNYGEHYDSVCEIMAELSKRGVAKGEGPAPWLAKLLKGSE